VERLCLTTETFIYHPLSSALPIGLPAQQGCERSPIEYHLALSYHRTRSIETYTQRVTEIWIGNQLSEVLVTDTTQRLEAKQEFLSSHSMKEPHARELTITLNQIQHAMRCAVMSTNQP